MTSKISFSKIRLEDLRHRNSVMLISCFVFFMKELFYFIGLQNVFFNHYGPYDQMDMMKKAVETGTAAGYSHMFYLTPLAILLGINGFYYLHNKVRVDFQHALPISRGRLFTMIVENSFLIFFVPYAISMVIHTGITATFGMASGNYFYWLAEALICDILVYLMIYLITVLSVILTGQTFVSLMAVGVFLTYAPIVIRYAIELFAYIFFDTFAGMPEGIVNVLSDLSPASLGLFLMMDGELHQYIAAIVWVLLLGIVTYLLFKKRPSESAGSAMAFQTGKKLIKVMITIPMSMFVGYLFYEITLKATILWLYFGVIFGVLLFHGIVECIYQSDIRGLWSKRKDLMVIAVFSMLIVLVFEVDLVRYDSFRPAADQVEFLTVDQFCDGSVINYSGESALEEKAIKEGIDGSEKEEILELIEAVQDHLPSTMDSVKTISVNYHMKNGTIKIRSYRLTKEQVDEIGKRLYASWNFKQKVYPILKNEKMDLYEITMQHPMNPINDTYKGDQEEFLRVYREELEKLTYEEAALEQPVCHIQLQYRLNDASNYYDTQAVYDVYPSFVKTIALIEAQGGKVGGSAKGINLSSLILNYRDENENNIEVMVTDQELIASVADRLYFDDLNSQVLRKDVAYDSIIEGRDARDSYYFYTDPETFEFLKSSARR